MSKIVVGIAVYNGSDYIRDALESLQKQTFQDFSVLISDNCSTDNTRKICNEFVKNDHRFNYICQDENIGGPANFNYLLSQTNSEYFMFLGHDDWLSDNFLELCVNYMDSNEDTSITSGVPLYYLKNSFYGTGVVHNHYQESSDLRLMGYYYKVKDNGIFYGLIRMKMINKEIFHDKVGDDHHWIAGVISKGKSKVIEKCNVHRRIGESSKMGGSNISTSLIFIQANIYVSQVYYRIMKMFKERIISFGSVVGVMIIVISRMYIKRFLGIKQFQLRKWVRNKTKFTN